MLTPENLFKKVSAYCGKAERCPAEVVQWLYKHEVPSEDHSHIIDQLTEEGLLNEERYIHAFASDKLRFAHWGPYRIQQDLLHRELPEYLVERIVPQVMEEEDAESILRDLLLKKLDLLEEPSPEEIQKKVIGWALGRGFYLQDIRQTLQTLLEE